MSGEIANCDNSKLSKDEDEVKLVATIGSRLMIVMFENNEILGLEINTARELKIPIFFIYSSEEDKGNYKVNERGHKIVFKNLEELEVILKNRN